MNANPIDVCGCPRVVAGESRNNSSPGLAKPVTWLLTGVLNIFVLLTLIAQVSCGGVEVHTSQEPPPGTHIPKEIPIPNTNAIRVNTIEDSIADDDRCSLREAILAANRNTGEYGCPAGSGTMVDSIILVSGQSYKLTILGADEEEGKTGDLDIIDDHNPLTHVDQTPVDILLFPLKEDDTIGNAEIVNAADDRELHIQREANASIWNVNFRNGRNAGDGGGIRNDGTLTLSSVKLENHQTKKNGGGIYSSGDLTIDGRSIIGGADSGNIAAVDGGGLYIAAGIARVSDSTISGNTATNGGGIYLDGGAATISDSTVGGERGGEGNEASNSGGGIRNRNGTLDIQNSVVSANAAADGGGIGNSGNLIITNSVIGGEGAGNTASGNGGGIIHDGGTLTIQNKSLISGNTAAYDGGGIYSVGAGSISDSTVGSVDAGNTARSGGGIENRGTLEIQGSTISGNSAVYGGGIGNSGSLTIMDSTIGGEGAGNSASSTGGGIANTGSIGAVTAISTKFLSNTAADEGGAVYHAVNNRNSLSISGSCIVNNSDTAIFNGSYESQSVSGNWWGKANGPYEAGDGLGDSVSFNLVYAGYLPAPILDCPDRNIRPHVIHILWFCWEGNSACDDLRNEVFPALEEKYLGQLMVVEIDVLETTGAPLWMDAVEYYHEELPPQVPFICMGDKYLMAPFAVSRIENMIIEGLDNGGVDWPSIPGFTPPEEE